MPAYLRKYYKRSRFIIHKPYNSLSKEDKELFAWLQDAETCGIKELEDVAATYRRWIKGILNAFKYNLSNGVTKGFNNKIKVLKLNSYGIKEFKRFKTRILHTAN